MPKDLRTSTIVFAMLAPLCVGCPATGTLADLADAQWIVDAAVSPFQSSVEVQGPETQRTGTESVGVLYARAASAPELALSVAAWAGGCPTFPDVEISIQGATSVVSRGEAGNADGFGDTCHPLHGVAFFDLAMLETDALTTFNIEISEGNVVWTISVNPVSLLSVGLADATGAGPLSSITAGDEFQMSTDSSTSEALAAAYKGAAADAAVLDPSTSGQDRFLAPASPDSGRVWALVVDEQPADGVVACDGPAACVLLHRAQVGSASLTVEE